MNRHRFFYANLSETLDDDEGYDDDYYGDEDLEYGEYPENYDGEYSEEADEEDYSMRKDVANPSNTTSMPTGSKESTPQSDAMVASAAPNPYFSISPEKDEDFDLLVSTIPQLDERWKEVSGVPLGEEEAISGLRVCNYDLEAAAVLLQEQREERKRERQQQSRILRACAEKPHSSAGCTPDNARGEEGASTPIRKDNAPGSEKVGENVSIGGRSSEAENGFPTSGSPCSPILSFGSPVVGKALSDCTLIVAGHVDAGKSTLLGHLLVLLGKVSLQSLSHPKAAGDRDGFPSSPREPPRYAWLLDQSEEERRRGVTIDAGTYNFQTEHRNIHVLDAPGHQDYILNMMSSATQADAALLIVAAATGEFEAGLHHGTKEHLRVLQILGVGSIIVAVNKMDMVKYEEERYNEVVKGVKNLFHELELDESCMSGVCPISGVDGTNLLPNNTGAEAMPWYKGPSLVEFLDSCPMEIRLTKGPLRISIQDIQGSVLYAKIESGRLKVKETIQFLPCNSTLSIKSITKPGGGRAMKEALAGEQVELLVSTPPVGVYPGCIGCSKSVPIPVSTDFEAQIQTFDALENPILPGSSLLLTAHALQVNIRIFRVVSIKNGSNGDEKWSTRMVKCIPKNKLAIIVFRAEGKVALEPVEVCRSLGRFALSQDGNTVAGGFIQKVLPSP